jgi:hypothetical protein
MMDYLSEPKVQVGLESKLLTTCWRRGSSGIISCGTSGIRYGQI